MTAKLAGDPLLPGGGDRRRPPPTAGARRGGRRRAVPPTSLVGSAAIAAGSGPQPLQIERQGLPRGPLQRGASLPGSRHPRHGRAVRPRHGRGAGGAVRRPGNGPDPRRLRPDPARLRRRPARHPLGRRRRSTGQDFTLNPTNCAPLATAAIAARRRRQPGQPGGLQLLPGQRPLPGAAAASALASGRSCSLRCSAATQARARTRSCGRSSSPAPATPTSAAPRSPCRKSLIPRPGAHREGLHPGPVRRRRLPGRTRSTATPTPRRRCSTSR